MNESPKPGTPEFRPGGFFPPIIECLGFSGETHALELVFDASRGNGKSENDIVVEIEHRYNALPALEARVKVLEEALEKCLPFVELAVTAELKTDGDKDQEALSSAREALKGAKS